MVAQAVTPLVYEARWKWCSSGLLLCADLLIFELDLRFWIYARTGFIATSVQMYNHPRWPARVLYNRSH